MAGHYAHHPVPVSYTHLLGYALLNGMVLSYYFLAFDLGTLVLAFLATSLYFGLMAVYGTTLSLIHI